MAGRARAHKDNGLVVSPVGLCGVEGIQRAQLDVHLLRLAGNAGDEVGVIQDDRLPVEGSIQCSDHGGIFQVDVATLGVEEGGSFP